MRLILVVLIGLSASLFADDPTLRVVTFNIHHGEGTDGKLDLERVARSLQALKPDVVALQEVDRGAARTGGVDQLQRLVELTGWHASFGQAMPFDGGTYGNSVLSRFPITGKSNHPLPFRKGQEPRAALVVTITPDNGLPSFRFVSTHFSHDREDVRVEQAGHFQKIMRPGVLPLIVAGDMNARPGSEPMKIFWENGWLDQVKPHSEIDYILTRKEEGWERVEVRVVDDRVTSDHRPVLVTLRWKGVR